VIVVTNEAINNVFKLDGGLQETFKMCGRPPPLLGEHQAKNQEFGSSVNKSMKK
jgi:hypothetical protein